MSATSVYSFSLCTRILLLLAFFPMLIQCITKQGHIFEEEKHFHNVLLETPSSISAVEIQFDVSFPVPEDNHCPLLYLRHDDQQESYNVHNGCFDRNKLYNNFRKDKQLWWFKDFSSPSETSMCRVKGDTIECKNKLQIALGYLSKWYVSVGYTCGEEKSANMTYNITLNEFNITCATFNTLDFFANPCHEKVVYDTYSKTNLVGYDHNDIAEFINSDYRMFYYLEKEKKGGCYKFAVHLGCRTFYPECRNNSIFPPCRQMCYDYVNGCSDVLSQDGKNISMSCTALPASLDKKICVYLEVICDHPGFIYNGDITINGSDNFQNTQIFPVGSVVAYSCHDTTVINGRHPSRTCLLSGQWSGEAPVCFQPEYTTDFKVIIMVAILCGTLPALIFCYLSVIQRFLYSKYPYKSHSRKLMSAVYKYDIDEIGDKSLLVHGSSDATRSYIRLLQQNDVVFTSNDQILPGQREVPALDKAIAQSLCAIFVVSEDILESDNIELILDMVTTNRYQRNCYWCYFIMMSKFETMQNLSTKKKWPLIAHLRRLSSTQSQSHQFKPSELEKLKKCLSQLKKLKPMIQDTPEC